MLAWFVCASAFATGPSGETQVPLGSGGQPVHGTVLLSAQELEDLVAPVALYPDELLAIVLPATTFPLQVVEAARYLDAQDADSSRDPDEDWDESVVALLNYPDVVKRLSDDLDWTSDLGQAVANQQEDVLAAVDRFRRKAQRAGNLESDQYQDVDVDADAVAIRPADPAVIYVPYYQPAEVVVWHNYDVVHYYQRPYPVYYYPYAADSYLMSNLTYPFWGVTSVFRIGWHSGHLERLRLDQRRHPYFGHAYAFDRYRYWRPHGGPRRLRERERHRASDRHDDGQRFRRDRDRDGRHHESRGQRSGTPAAISSPTFGRTTERSHREAMTAPRHHRSSGPTSRRATTADARVRQRPATVTRATPPSRTTRHPRTSPAPRSARTPRTATNRQSRSARRGAPPLQGTTTHRATSRADPRAGQKAEARSGRPLIRRAEAERRSARQANTRGAGRPR